MAEALSFDDLVPKGGVTTDLIGAGPEPQQEDPWVSGGLSLLDHLEGSDAAARQQSRLSGKSISADQVVSPAGAIGRFQVTPDTARTYGYDPSKLTDPAYNRQVASTVLSSLRDRYSDDSGNTDWSRVLIGYNAGPGVADRWDGNVEHLPKETRKYLARGEEYLGLPGAFTAQQQPQAPDFSDLVPGSAHGNIIHFDDLVPKSQLPKPEQPESGLLDTLGMAISNTPARWKQMAAGALEGLSETPAQFMPRSIAASEFAPPLQDTPQDTADKKKISVYAHDLYGRAQAQIKANSPNIAPGSAKDYAYQITAGLIDITPLLAATAVTKSPVIGGEMMAGQAAAQQYGEARAAGRSADQARMDALFSGTVNGVLGSVPLGIVMKPGQTFLGKTIKGAASFGAVSVLTEAMQVGYDRGLVTPDMTIGQAWDRVKQAGIVGTLQGAFLGAGHAGLEIAANHLRSTPESLQRAANIPGTTVEVNGKRVEPKPLTTPQKKPARTPSPAPQKAGGPEGVAVPPATTGIEYGAATPVSHETPEPEVPQGEAQSVTPAEAVSSSRPEHTEQPHERPHTTTPEQENVAGALIENHRPEGERPPGPKWTNAHVIQQEHDDEIIRLETEGIKSALKPKGGNLVDFGDLVPPTAEAGVTPRPDVDRRDLPAGPEPDVAITATGRKVPVQYAVVEADHLTPSQTLEGHPNPEYPTELQPRDRSRVASVEQISNIAQNLDPKLLDRGIPLASHGAPIISRDGIVESGNGRTLAIQQAYGNGLDTAEGYRAHLAAQGYPVEGMRKPMLVRVRTADMTPEERQAFTQEANEAGTMALSATERAMGDAAALPDHILPLYRGGDIENGQNRDFVRAFIEHVVPPSERAGMITGDGAISQDAIRRIRAALLAKAYGDAHLVAKVIESADENIRAIGGALTDVAGDWSQMRARVAAGQLSAELDQTVNLINAVRIVQHARANGRTIAEYVGQGDIFSGESVSPETELFLQLMFRNDGELAKDWTRPSGRDKLAEALRFYVAEALKAGVGTDLLGETAPEPGRILALAKARQYPAGETGPGLFTARPESPGGNAAAGGGAGAGPQGAPAAVPAGVPSPGPQPEVAPQIETIESLAAKGLEPAAHKLAGMVALRLALHQPISADDLLGMATRVYGGTLADGTIPRDELYDALELGVNTYIASFPATFPIDVDDVDATRVANSLKALKETLPTQTVRAGEKESKQQFSTPPDYSYAAAWAANIGPHDRVLEPSAGTGSFIADAVNARPEKIWANEISERRAAMLKKFRIDGVFEENAEHLNSILPPSVRPTVVLMNPPFSVSPGMEGSRVLEAGARHVAQALERLQPGGRLIAIVGRGMTPDAPFFRNWWREITRDNDVRANIGVDGSIYRKYGTTFSTRLLVIDKRPPSGRAPVVRDVQTADEIVEALKDVRSDREPAGAQSGGPALVAPRPDTGAPGQSVPPATGAVGPQQGAPPERIEGAGNEPQRPGGSGGAASGAPGSGPRVPVAPEKPERPANVGAGPEPGTGTPAGSGPLSGSNGGAGDGIVPDGSGQRDDPGVTPAPETVKAEELSVQPKMYDAPITDTVFEDYKPTKVIEGAEEHRGALVQSSAMATTDAPPLAYKPDLPEKITKTGGLSDAQLEAIARAGAAHEQIIPASGKEEARRGGFFIGDGTGVGKGRETAGIIMDNFNKGRTKALWISQNRKLVNDARRDWGGIGGNPKQIVEQGAFKPANAIKHDRGIIFTTYDTLKSSAKPDLKPGESKFNDDGTAKLWPTRLQQIVDWVGKDFDGVIAFDEAHNMANSMDVNDSMGTKQASQKAMAGVELQRLLPQSRVVYLSATGATEVQNLAYADRLGLWGKGTAFADKTVFISKIASGGIAAMELVARDMKAMGQYMARNLSFQGVEYDRVEHKLTPDQRDTYDKLASSWQVVLQNFYKALAKTGVIEVRPDGTVKILNSRAKSRIESLFWATHQRFFNQVITAMQMPTVLDRMEGDLKVGRQVVLQLVNTNEAAQERALAGMGEDDDLEELDMSPRTQLLQLVDKAYPTQRFEQYRDEDGNVRSRPVVDKAGNPVHDPVLLAAKERLLDELGALKVPDAPLDMIVNHFGVDRVAEVTGRKRRVVRKLDAGGQMRMMEEKRPAGAAVSETTLFQDSKKPILVFSQAGDTGRSYHAEIGSGSADKRRSHYLVQAGWRADRAVQGFGRAHRTNQASAPLFHLVTTDIEGQKRFISSIARRLAQLGALTKGERRAADQGLFGLRDNLESSEAKDALVKFYGDAASGAIPGIGVRDLERQMGLKLIDPNTGTLYDRLPDITRFLNRLLSLNLPMQTKVFGAFSDRLDEVIDRAAAAGTLDTGVETYHADTINKVSDQIVHRDPRMGAPTRHVHLEIGRKTKPIPYDMVAAGKIMTGGKVPSGFVRSLRGNKVFAVSEAKHRMDAKTGAMIDQVRLTDPNSYQFLDQDNLKDGRYWQPVKDEQEARSEWQRMVEETPAFAKSDLHIITGAVLPIWDRLSGSPKIYRLQTDQGEHLLGRVVPNDSINDVLQKLGAEATKVTATPAEMVSRIMDGEQATLSNGWKIKRVTVAGQPRLELTGPDNRYMDQLKVDGVFVERIDYKTRFFVPTGARAEGIIAGLHNDHPVTSLFRPSKAQAAFHGSPYDFDEFRNDNIGSGEGAQAYGWGHYFAGKRGVAQYYRDMLAGRAYPSADELAHYFRPGRVVPGYGGYDRVLRFYPDGSDYGGGWHVLVQGVEKHNGEWIDKPRDIRDHQTTPDAHQIAQSYRDEGLRPPTRGKLYTVDLAPKDDEWLDYDKPLTEQPEGVKEKLKSADLWPRQEYEQSDWDIAHNWPGNEEATGGQFYQKLRSRFGHDRYVSEQLGMAGIPGIRYADQMSRAAKAAALNEIPRLNEELRKTEVARDAARARGEGDVAAHHEALIGDIQKMVAKAEEDAAGATHNYVVFDPKHIDIRAKEQREFGQRVGARALGGTEELAPDTLGYRTLELTPEEKSVHDAVMRIAARIVPGAETRMMRAIEAVDPGSKSSRGVRVFGSNYGPAFRRMIALSLESPDPTVTMKHEAVHWLLDSHLIRPDEWKILRRAAVDGGWLDKWDIAKRYPNLGREFQIEEAVADHFGSWLRGDRNPGEVFAKDITPIFRKIREFLAQVADYLRRTFGKEATADDIFSRISSGEIGARTQAEVRDQMGAKAQAALTPKKEPEPEARGVYAAIDRALGAPLRRAGDRLADAIDRTPSALHDLGEAAQMGVTPMAAGEGKYRAWAKDFANALRGIMDEHDRVDRWLKSNFTPDDLRQMYDAMDIEGVSKRMDRPIPEGEGLDSLPPRLRATAEELERRNNETAALARKFKMLRQPLEHYVPRMGVVWYGGEAVRPSRKGGVTADLGRNLRTTTPQLLRRKYEEIEATESAFKARFGEEGEIVHNIRALNLATRNLQQAIAGRKLIENLRTDANAVGKAAVVEGEHADPQQYFTIPGHPAFERWEPEFVNEGGKVVPRVDSSGAMVFQRKQLWVAKEAEGPLRAVLSKDMGAWNRALLSLKAKTMSLIMFSPTIHNQVIWGRAFPAAPMRLLLPKIYKGEDGWHYGIWLYVDGNAARRDPELRKRAIAAGMDPIGRRYFNQDITAIAEGDNIEPGRSWTAQTLSLIPGLFDPRAGEAVRQFVDRVGDFWHNTLLWDRVADLQMGLWKLMSESFASHGLPQGAADKVAAHFANRYAGALPLEAMGKVARAWANWILFSRSFTLGNLAAFKDASFGLPRDVQSQIERDYGQKALDLAQGMARRKAFTLILGDILASKISLVMGSAAVAAAVYAMTGVWKYHPTSQNEPEDQNRVFVGHAADGTAIYARLPLGKTAEDLQDWPAQPRNVLLRKLSPQARIALAVAGNDKGFGRKLFDDQDKSLGGDIDALLQIGGKIVDSLLPIGEFEFAKNLIIGKGDTATNAAGAVLPLATGITISHGAPGGEAQGEYLRARQQHDFKVQEALPAIRAKIKHGDIAGARQDMTALGMRPHEQGFYIRTTLHPGGGLTRSERRNINRWGTVEQQERIRQDLAH